MYQDLRFKDTCDLKKMKICTHLRKSRRTEIVEGFRLRAPDLSLRQGYLHSVGVGAEGKDVQEGPAVQETFHRLKITERVKIK